MHCNHGIQSDHNDDDIVDDDDDDDDDDSDNVDDEDFDGDDDDLDKEGQVDLCQGERTTSVQHSLSPGNVQDITRLIIILIVLINIENNHPSSFE